MNVITPQEKKRILTLSKNLDEYIKRFETVTHQLTVNMNHKYAKNHLWLINSKLEEAQAEFKKFIEIYGID